MDQSEERISELENRLILVLNYLRDRGRNKVHKNTANTCYITENLSKITWN